MTGGAPFVPSRWIKVRLYVSVSLLAALFVVYGFCAFNLQVRQVAHFKALAEAGYARDIELQPMRGRILDRRGEVLAASVEVDSVHCNPRLIGGAAAPLSERLAPILAMEKKELERRLSEGRYFSWVKRRISPEEAQRVRALQIPGLFVAKESRRYYPHRALGGALLGWAGVDGVGQEGIELAFDRAMRGERTEVAGMQDALGRQLFPSGLGDTSAQKGHDVETTLDRFLQFRLEQALEKGVATHHAKAGTAVLLDVQSGEIYAMAAVPSVNPNAPNEGRQKGVRNRAVTDPFEPGSTMKTFTLAGALEARAIGENDHWYCENGHFQVGPATIHDAESIGNATTTEVLAKSSNICVAKIAAKLGRVRLHDMLLRFGFARPTAVDLPGERSGQVRASDRMGPVETATMAFGQGLTATPLQVAAAYAAIADGGVWHRPHVLRRVLDRNGGLVAQGEKSDRQVISPELAATLRKFLYAVTQPGGTAEHIHVPGYRFAGKTGTAQKVDPATRRYSSDHWASSFVGFAPLAEPRLALFVMVDEPQGVHFGSMVAAPVFAEVMSEALRWLGVAPEEQQPMKPPVASPVVPTGATLPLDGTAVSERPAAGKKRVPNFVGLSMAEALKLALKEGLRVEVRGSGVAVSQSPPPGIHAVRRVRISFSS